MSWNNLWFGWYDQTPTQWENPNLSQPGSTDHVINLSLLNLLRQSSSESEDENEKESSVPLWSPKGGKWRAAIFVTIFFRVDRKIQSLLRRQRLRNPDGSLGKNYETWIASAHCGMPHTNYSDFPEKLPRFCYVAGTVLSLWPRKNYSD